MTKVNDQFLESLAEVVQRRIERGEQVTLQPSVRHEVDACLRRKVRQADRAETRRDADKESVRAFYARLGRPTDHVDLRPYDLPD